MKLAVIDCKSYVARQTCPGFALRGLGAVFCKLHSGIEFINHSGALFGMDQQSLHWIKLFIHIERLVTQADGSHISVNWFFGCHYHQVAAYFLQTDRLGHYQESRTQQKLVFSPYSVPYSQN